MNDTVPDPYQVRPAQPADAAAIVAVMEASDLAQVGETEGHSAHDIADEIAAIDGQTRAFVVETRDASVVAYALVANEGFGRIFADNYVHPAHRSHGLGTALVRLTERAARDYIAGAPAGARVTLANGVYASDAAACGILMSAGYARSRVHWLMRIDLEELPPAPTLPTGVTVRTFQLGRDERATFDCVNEAFSDHWGHVPGNFEHWICRTTLPDFDPSLWFLAEHGGSLAGAVLCHRRPHIGWVNTLAVRRPWRQRGLGLALLQQAFVAFSERGERRVGLGVNSQNLTGATRLYERVGMHVHTSIVTFELELRSGTDLRTMDVRTLDTDA